MFAIDESMLTVAEEALYLLRQDVSLPSVEEAATDRRMEWLKCRAAFELSATEVLAAHDWRFARDNDQASATVSVWPANIRKLVVYRLAAEMAVQIAGRTEDLKNWHALYSSMLVDARVKDLSEDKSDDPVVREVIAAIRSLFAVDTPSLPRSMLLVYERIDDVRTVSYEEVKDAHDWTGKAGFTKGEDLPPLARQAWIALVEAKLGVACGLPAEAVAKLEEVYLFRLIQARAADLERSRSDDEVVREVLAGIRPYFALDQKNLPLTMISLYERVDDVRASAFKEILAAHDWQDGDSITEGEDLPAQARAAWIALIQQKLAIACGLGPEAMAAFESLWRAKLQEARVTDLETTPVPEGVEGDVLTAIRSVFSTAETLPRSLDSLVARIERMKPLVMKEILAAFPWGFALEEEVTVSVPHGTPGSGEYGFEAQVPLDSLRIVSVHGRDGELAHVEELGGVLRSHEPIVRIVYVRDIEDLDRFPPGIRRLVVLKLAADLAKTVAAKPENRELQERLYRDALEEAKVRDARGSNPTPRSLWGGNFYVEQMDAGRSMSYRRHGRR